MNTFLSASKNGSLKKELRKLFKKIREDKNRYLINNSLEKEFIEKSFEEKLSYLIKQQEQELSNLNKDTIFSNKDICVACYYPIQSEINCLNILSKIKEEFKNSLFINLTICLPKMHSEERFLRFYEYQHTNEQSLIEGDFKIKEPDTNISREVDPDIIITPLLAFDKHKHRLGYGKGYYDKTFLILRENRKDFISIGIAYDEQFYNDSLPLCEFDQKLDFMITPNQII